MFFSENRDELENIIVDVRGVINDASNKIFSTDVLQEKHEITQQEKICKSIKKSNKRQNEEKIRKDRPIFDKEHCCKEPVPKRNPNERLNSENMRDHNNQAIIESSHKSTSQPYFFPSCSRILEGINYDKPDDQQPENFQVSETVRNFALYYSVTKNILRNILNVIKIHNLKYEDLSIYSFDHLLETF